MLVEDYITEKKVEFAMNIAEFSISQTIVDNGEDWWKQECKGRDVVISDMTQNSIEVYIKRVTDEGIDCKQWFNMKSFSKRFKTKK